jgi:hypothetical protein
MTGMAFAVEMGVTGVISGVGVFGTDGKWIFPEAQPIER